MNLSSVRKQHGQPHLAAGRMSGLSTFVIAVSSTAVAPVIILPLTVPGPVLGEGMGQCSSEGRATAAGGRAQMPLAQIDFFPVYPLAPIPGSPRQLPW